MEQSNFFRQVRNLIIDTEDTATSHVADLHWQVAQVASLSNVYISARTVAGTTQMGMFTENGSGGFMSDCTIAGGQYGIYGGNLQVFHQTKASIFLLWDWGWTWAGQYLERAPIGLALVNPEDPHGQQARSTYRLDSQFVDADRHPGPL